MGGFMGLLLGASVLTVFELFDLVLFNFVKKFQRRQRIRRESRRLSRLSLSPTPTPEIHQTPSKSPKITISPPTTNGIKDGGSRSPTVNFAEKDSYFTYDDA